MYRVNLQFHLVLCLMLLLSCGYNKKKGSHGEVNTTNQEIVNFEGNLDFTEEYADSKTFSNSLHKPSLLDILEIIDIKDLSVGTGRTVNQYEVRYQIKGEFENCLILTKDIESSWNIALHDVTYSGEEYSIKKFKGKDYLIKSWSSGSGGYLNFEMYTLNDMNKYQKVFELPDNFNNLDTFQGNVYYEDSDILFSLSSRKYKLARDVKDSIYILPINERLSSSEIKSNEHIIAINREDRDNPEFSFNGKKVTFRLDTTINELYSEFVYPIHINDTIWIDDNCKDNAAVRFFLQDNFPLINGLYNRVVAKHRGDQSYSITLGYDTPYNMRFHVN